MTQLSALVGQRVVLCSVDPLVDPTICGPPRHTLLTPEPIKVLC